MSAAAGKTVLVVEDDADVRAALGLLLESHGYPVLEAEHGAEALTLLRDRADVGVILLDLMMPVMDGSTFRVEQRKDAALADIPVVVVTADAAGADRARELGAAAHLPKPIDLDRLLAVVRSYC